MGPQHAGLARALLEKPATAWWFNPLDRDRQVWFPLQEIHQAHFHRAHFDRGSQARALLKGASPDPARIVKPENPTFDFEPYAERLGGGFHTSTLVQGTSSLFVAFDEVVGGIGTAHPFPPFAPSWLLKVVASARVFEIDGPMSWHNLCLRYPAEGRSNLHEPDFSGDKGRLVPNRWAFWADWDAVHLTHWGWDAEQTMWLRWMFTESERMIPHERSRPPRIPLRGPFTVR